MHEFSRRLRRFARRARQSLNRYTMRAARRIRGFLSWLSADKRRMRAALISGTAGGLALVMILSIFVFSGPGKEDVAMARIAAPSHWEDGLVEILVPRRTDPGEMPSVTPTPPPILGRGMEGAEVQELQERLMGLGYLDIDESTQYFGSATEDALELFQRQVNFTETLSMDIQEDGLAGSETKSLLFSDSAPKYCVKEGMEGSDIVAMQQQLVDMGYMKKATGYYGDETVAAIKDFQSRNNLTVDGLAGEMTHEMLYSPEAKESASMARQARTKANINEMIEAAKDKLGCKYVLGNTGPKSFDCSGLVYYCLREAGSNRRRLNAAGYSRVEDWEKISKMSGLKKGDLIFFYSDDYSKVGHVGIVISDGTMIDASSANGKVVRRSYTTSYWKNHFVCGRRPW